LFESAQREGLRFGCTGCAFCCGGSPGFVWLSREDLDLLCALRALSEKEFLETFCRFVDVGEGRAVSLREKPGYDCIFLENGRCSVYGARPLQCRTYPFWEEIVDSEKAWYEEAISCPGIGKGRNVPPEEIAAAILARRGHHRLLLSASADSLDSREESR
jgi:Fe-S-cluster containining protein